MEPNKLTIMSEMYRQEGTDIEVEGLTVIVDGEEVLEAFTGRAPNPERNKVTDEDREKMRELCQKLAKLSPEERKKLVTPKPGDIEDFII